MLYVTTRNATDVYTASWPLTHNRGGDGGLFLPFRLPELTGEEIASLGTMTFDQRMAKLLNLMFGTRLSGWDLEFAIGRYPARRTVLAHRIHMAECWRNPGWNYQRTVEKITGLLTSQDATPANWVKIGVRISVLFALYGDLLECGVIAAGERVDVSLVSGDFSGPMAAYYARQWGLPIGSIVCCCNENNELWNLICHGQLRTDTVAAETFTPEADIVLPEDLERLIFACGGREETARYLQCRTEGRSYYPSSETLAGIRDGQFVSVVSNHRVVESIPGVYKTHRYLMSPYTALAYNGLLDYRAKKGILRHSLVIADRSPLLDEDTVAQAMGVPKAQLKEFM